MNKKLINNKKKQHSFVIIFLIGEKKVGIFFRSGSFFPRSGCGSISIWYGSTTLVAVTNIKLKIIFNFFTVQDAGSPKCVNLNQQHSSLLNISILRFWQFLTLKNILPLTTLIKTSLFWGNLTPNSFIQRPSHGLKSLAIDLSLRVAVA